MEIKNYVAIVTGGASGMGAATAKQLSMAGAKVAIWDMNKDAANKLAQEINGIAVHCDVTDAESIENAIQQTENQLGSIRICVNCAGIITRGRIVNKKGPISLDEFRKTIEVNLIGTFNVMRLVAEKMSHLEPINSSDERGVIINTASVAAFEGQIGQAAYSASKGGITSLTLPAARELAQFGIRVVAIAPGIVATAMLAEIPETTRQALIETVPFPKRLGHPDEYAKLALHIIDNVMLNGCVIRLDGALRLQAK
jgi:NAD(P)-dependent dehydrogenase (short-subunit alcohol dehydrogenase family)